MKLEQRIMNVVNYGSVVEEFVDSHCQTVSSTANKLATSFVQLETKDQVRNCRNCSKRPRNRRINSSWIKG